jgi:CRISPR-associated protein Cmx8
MIELIYRLGQLPSPAYRAGLAGLVFLILYLHRDRPETKTEIQVEFDSLGATLRCDREGLQALINLTFDARYELKWSQNRIQNPVEVRETEDGRLYGWNLLVVNGAPLRERDSSGIWTNLWSEWLLNTIRAIPKSRKPFKLRANQEPISIEKLWTALQRPNSKVGLSSSALIGAEAKNSEGVSLDDTNAQQFLLNFWPYVSQPYVPCRFDTDGKREDWGYAVAIPDVQDLEAFVETFPDLLDRHPQNPPQYNGYRPLGALVELPEEAALDSLRLIRERMKLTDIASTLEYDVLGFEVCHAVRSDPKRGADLMAIAYIQPDLERDDRYAKIRNIFRCAWFRRHLLQNLLKNRPWTARWGALLSTASQQWFEDRFFPHDCKLIFNREKNAVELSELAQILKSLCDRYLIARLVSKNQEITWDNKHKLARQEFLAVRSRTEKTAFREYFFGTLCSQVTPVVSADLDESSTKKEQYKNREDEKLRQTIALAEALEKDPETVRGLTMLALASNFKIAEKIDSSSPSNSQAS